MRDRRIPSRAEWIRNRSRIPSDPRALRPRIHNEGEEPDVKQQLMQMMTAMMPFMKPLVWLGCGSAVLALVLGFFGSGALRRLAGLFTVVTIAVGVFFTAAWFMGLWMDAQPSINFGDPRKMEFRLVPFIWLGLGFLAIGAVLRFMGRRGRS